MSLVSILGRQSRRRSYWLATLGVAASLAWLVGVALASHTTSTTQNGVSLSGSVSDAYYTAPDGSTYYTPRASTSASSSMASIKAGAGGRVWCGTTVMAKNYTENLTSGPSASAQTSVDANTACYGKAYSSSGSHTANDSPKGVSWGANTSCSAYNGYPGYPCPH